MEKTLIYTTYDIRDVDCQRTYASLNNPANLDSVRQTPSVEQHLTITQNEIIYRALIYVMAIEVNSTPCELQHK
jgi:hypothetical protein